jgi:hypothetical protein
MTQRLFVRAITSIGAVEEGDNSPHSSILFWKRKPLTKPEVLQRRPGIAAALHASAPGPSSGAEGAAAVQKRIATNLAATAKTSEEIRKTLEEIEQLRGTTMTSRRSRTEPADTVRAAVDRLATELVEKGEAPNLVQGRVQVWKGRPDLVAKSRQEIPDPVSDEPEMTISDRVVQVIKDAAVEASFRPLMENWGRSESRESIISKVRVEMWRTPEGQALRDLDRAIGSKPYTTDTVAAIRKSKNATRFGLALDVLDRGIRLPG